MTTMAERRNVMEFFRDHAAEVFEAHTGSTWRPHAGSRVNHRAKAHRLSIGAEAIPRARREYEIARATPMAIRERRV